MPIYEYHCQDCQAQFELLRSFKDADAEVTCTECQGKNVRRKLSLFNAATSSSAITNGGGCSGCAGGSCSSCGSH
jgi:putative FmdB family regulatory protein